MTDAEAWLELADIYLENLKYFIFFVKICDIHGIRFLKKNQKILKKKPKKMKNQRKTQKFH